MHAFFLWISTQLKVEDWFELDDLFISNEIFFQFFYCLISDSNQDSFGIIIKCNVYHSNKFWLISNRKMIHNTEKHFKSSIFPTYQYSVSLSTAVNWSSSKTRLSVCIENYYRPKKKNNGYHMTNDRFSHWRGCCCCCYFFFFLDGFTHIFFGDWIDWFLVGFLATVSQSSNKTMLKFQLKTSQKKNKQHVWIATEYSICVTGNNWKENEVNAGFFWRWKCLSHLWYTLQILTKPYGTIWFGKCFMCVCGCEAI